MKRLFTLSLFLFAIGLHSAEIKYKGWIHSEGEWKVIEIKDNGEAYTQETTFDEKLWKNSKYPVLVIRDKRSGKEGRFMTSPIYGKEKIVKRPIISHGKKVAEKTEKWIYYNHPKGRWIRTIKVCDVGECVDDKEILGFLKKTSSGDGNYVYSMDTEAGRLVLFPSEVERDGGIIAKGLLLTGQALEKVNDLIEEAKERIEEVEGADENTGNRKLSTEDRNPSGEDQSRD